MDHSDPGVSLKGLRKTGSIHGQARQAGSGSGGLMRPMSEGGLVGGTLPPQRLSGEISIGWLVMKVNIIYFVFSLWIR